jgi:L-gulonolactone oxidase
VSRAFHRSIAEPSFRDEADQLLRSAKPAIGHGLGRSYGDVGLNSGGTLIRTARLDRVIAADWSTGVFRAEAGMSLDALLQLSVPRGWFVPVTPGTKFVTLGGAVANDVHGKNHEGAGTFGCHVRALGLLRSDGAEHELGPDRGDPPLWAATIGGLGLTGLILWVELQLTPIRSAFFDAEVLRLKGLDDFFRASEESRDWPYTVAWVDCLAKGAGLGRGLYTRGRFSDEGGLLLHKQKRALKVPLDAPAALLSSPTVRLFNLAYGGRPGVEGSRRIHYDPFLYPLDGIHDWNRLYGRPGFFQHQSVIPMAQAPDALRKLLELTSSRNQGSFLVVLKLFGAKKSPGILSFPTEGATFALDLPNRGEPTRKLLDAMTDVVMEAGGRLYPAKDATMSAETFQAGYPRWREVEAQRDSNFTSDFWRRVTREAALEIP